MIGFHISDKALLVEGLTNNTDGKICFTFFTGKKRLFLPVKK